MPGPPSAASLGRAGCRALFPQQQKSFLLVEFAIASKVFGRCDVIILWIFGPCPTRNKKNWMKIGSGERYLNA
jgi:hypothetical protein